MVQKIRKKLKELKALKEFKESPFFDEAMIIVDRDLCKYILENPKEFKLSEESLDYISWKYEKLKIKAQEILEKYRKE